MRTLYCSYFSLDCCMSSSVYVSEVSVTVSVHCAHFIRCLTFGWWGSPCGIRQWPRQGNARNMSIGSPNSGKLTLNCDVHFFFSSICTWGRQGKLTDLERRCIFLLEDAGGCWRCFQLRMPCNKPDQVCPACTGILTSLYLWSMPIGLMHFTYSDPVIHSSFKFTKCQTPRSRDIAVSGSFLSGTFARPQPSSCDLGLMHGKVCPRKRPAHKVAMAREPNKTTSNIL